MNLKVMSTYILPSPVIEHKPLYKILLLPLCIKLYRLYCVAYIVFTCNVKSVITSSIVVFTELVHICSFYVCHCFSR